MRIHVEDKKLLIITEPKTSHFDLLKNTDSWKDSWDSMKWILS